MVVRIQRETVMGEKQEKVWVVMRRRAGSVMAEPAKVFDDRKDARAYMKTMVARAKVWIYWVVGVKKG